MKLEIFNLNREKVSEVSDNFSSLSVKFDKKFFETCYAKAKKVHTKNKTASKKNRSEISLTGSKMYRQKGTGNARHSSASANIFVGGAKYYTIKPCDRNFKLNKNESLLMRQMCLSYKLANNSLFFVDNPHFDRISTKDAAKTLATYGKSVLIVLKEKPSSTTLLSIRNLPFAKCCTFSMLTSQDIINHEVLILDSKLIEYQFKDEVYDAR